MSNPQDYERMAADAAAQVLAELDAQMAQQAPSAQPVAVETSHPAVRRSARNRTPSPLTQTDTPPTDISTSPASRKRKQASPSTSPSSSKISKTTKGKKPTSAKTTEPPAITIDTTIQPTANSAESQYTLALETQVAELSVQVVNLQGELETLQGAATLLEMALHGTIAAQRDSLIKTERSQEKLRARVGRAFMFENF